MKITLFVLLIVCTSTALAQSYAPVLSSQPQMLQMPSHTEHASLKPLATPQYILQGSGPSSAQGVRPLWEFPVASEEVSLGEAARILRKEHALAKKAKKIFSDQL